MEARGVTDLGFLPPLQKHTPLAFPAVSRSRSEHHRRTLGDARSSGLPQGPRHSSRHPEQQRCRTHCEGAAYGDCSDATATCVGIFTGLPGRYFLSRFPWKSGGEPRGEEFRKPSHPQQAGEAGLDSTYQQNRKPTRKWVTRHPMNQTAKQQAQIKFPGKKLRCRFQITGRP